MENIDKSEIFILAVDDNQDNLRVVSSFLKDKGYKIALALNGHDALEILNNTKIDLVLLDIMMPKMDGFTVCKKIKENPKLVDIPIIFLTAKTETDDIVKGFEMGGVDYITKPFKKEELYARVSSHITIKRTQDYIKKRLKDVSKSRNEVMKMTLDMAKLLNVRSDG
ncbi:response regulator [Plebeiibacterium sediminum]|uniref:histidine kinase n=1 Tax=Plebeiibacterium sediminum TaxID=2992112 RepID=A0AAE3SFP2_9BACT|nr:response regulator [Plebeiobacterium sediminum]MCW3787471.1 response regulator [Plebeiobacterium sediminum]